MRFLVAGTINTALTYGLYLVLLGALGYWLAYSIAYLAGIVFSYFVVSRFVFRVRTSMASFLRYPLVYVVQWVVGTIVLWVCVEVIGVGRELALIPTIAATIPVTFLLSRRVLSVHHR